MDENTVNDRLMKRASLLPGRALWAGFPVTVAAVSFLWVTGYPVEEWPFIGAVLMGCMFLSGTFVGLAVFFVGRWLEQYGRRVLLQRGIDAEPLDQGDGVPGAIQIVIVAAVVLLMSATIWGASVYGLVLVISRMNMPPLGAELAVVAPILLGVGVFGLFVAFGTPATVFFLASGGSPRLVSTEMRARASTARAFLGLALRARAGPFTVVRLDKAAELPRG